MTSATLNGMHPPHSRRHGSTVLGGHDRIGCQDSAMTVNVQLDQDTVHALGALADARGMTLAASLRYLVKEMKAADSGAFSLADFERGLAELAADLPDLPALPPDFSRADIYAEH